LALTSALLSAGAAAVCCVASSTGAAAVCWAAAIWLGSTAAGAMLAVLLSSVSPRVVREWWSEWRT